VKGQGQRALVEGGEDLDEAVLVNGLVADRGDHEAEHARPFRELVDELEAGVRVAER
jgi:hypothetical protein